MRLLDGMSDSVNNSLGRLRFGDAQGGLACCDSWGSKELDTTERLNYTELMVLESVLVSFFYKWLTSFPSTTC